MGEFPLKPGDILMQLLKDGEFEWFQLQPSAPIGKICMEYFEKVKAEYDEY